MVIGIGTDIVSIDRIQAMSEGAVARVLTADEAAYCAKYPRAGERIAGRFAAKEAILKALGTGWGQGLGWDQLEILPDELGSPRVTLRGEAHRRMLALGASHCFITISHEKTYAVAFAVLVRQEAIDPSLTQTSP